MKRSLKIVATALIFTVGPMAFASDCLQSLDEHLRLMGNNPKFYSGAIECQADNNETQVVTPEGRLIFKSKNLCLITTTQTEHGEDTIVQLKDPGMGTHYFGARTAKYEHNGDSFSATERENVYPSGNVTKKYVVESKLTINGTSSMTPKIEFKRSKKKLFGKNELLYINTYDCKRVF